MTMRVVCGLVAPKGLRIMGAFVVALLLLLSLTDETIASMRNPVVSAVAASHQNPTDAHCARLGNESQLMVVEDDDEGKEGDQYFPSVKPQPPSPQR